MTGTSERRSRLTDLGRESRALVLRAVRDQGALARHQLAERTGLSKAAINGIVDGLLADGRLLGLDEERQRGVPVGLNAAYASVAGLEVTNDGLVRSVVVDTTGEVLRSVEGHFDAGAPPEEVAKSLAATAREALQLHTGAAPAARNGRSARNGRAAGSVREANGRVPRRAVGIAVPGTVDTNAGVARWLPIAHNWFDVPLRSLVQEALGVPVLVDWRAYTTTLAEIRYGAARGVEHVLCLYLGEGIGMGIGRHGRVLRGAGDQAGSVAHLQVAPDALDGPICHCGMRGCLWSVASIPAVLRRVAGAVDEGALSLAARGADFAGVLSAARAGDRLCTEVLRDVALATGRAVAACVHVLNPQQVLVGGPLAEAADLLAAPLTAEVERRTFPWISPKPSIHFSTLGPYAAARGAAALATDLLLEVETAGER